MVIKQYATLLRQTKSKSPINRTNKQPKRQQPTKNTPTNKPANHHINKVINTSKLQARINQKTIKAIKQ